MEPTIVRDRGDGLEIEGASLTIGPQGLVVGQTSVMGIIRKRFPLEQSDGLPVATKIDRRVRVILEFLDD